MAKSKALGEHGRNVLTQCKSKKQLHQLDKLLSFQSQEMQLQKKQDFETYMTGYIQRLADVISEKDMGFVSPIHVRQIAGKCFEIKGTNERALMYAAEYTELYLRRLWHKFYPESVKKQERGLL